MFERLHGHIKFGAGNGPGLTIVKKIVKHPDGMAFLGMIIVTMRPFSPNESGFEA
ncbi:hypothetical protein [Candidatus Nitrospira allomarina]|uniref:Uncharacterized protein n=1 Tax=Candidatus Nitrospira allomarina TaxID=3020900 RepID=A0AA96GF26_9BACT|nr:hypothetical protein [Candidatus Nitrospira allomarina]WNM57693.1 hypothetical protein PP769_17240 [Candidatus Nitrospira allomarina]